MSFVDNHGNDTADPALHGFRWMRMANNQETESIRAWQPWMQYDTKGTTICVDWAEATSLALEVATFDPTMTNASVIVSVPGTNCIRRILISASISIPKMAVTRAQAASQLIKAKNNLAPQDRALTIIRVLDLLTRNGLVLPAWVTNITYGILDGAATGTEALIFLYYYEADAMRAPAGASASLVAFRRAAEGSRRLQRIVGWQPYPAGPPIPAVIDNVDPNIVAFAVAEAMGDTGFNDAALRGYAPAGPARTSARHAEVDGVVHRPDGNTPEMRKRAIHTAGACATNITALLDPRGTEVFSTPRAVSAISAVAAICLSAAQRAPEVLFSQAGLRTLHLALTAHVAWCAFAEVIDLATADKIEALATRAAQMHGGPALLGAVGAQGAGGQLGATSNVGNWRTGAINALQTGAAADIIHEAETLLSAEGTRSEDLHERLFRGCSAAAPDRKSTGLLHSIAWGNSDAGSLNQAWSLLKSYSSDESIGRYLAKLIVAQMRRDGSLTDDHVQRLDGLSMTSLAKALRGPTWGGGSVDIVNDVIGIINSKLSEATGMAPAGRMPYALVYADPATCRRVPKILSAILEALGLQRDGPGSVREQMEVTQNTILGHEGQLPPDAIAKLMKSQKELWEASLQETVDLYHHCRSGANVNADLPTVNLRSGVAMMKRNAFNKLAIDIVQAYYTQSLAGTVNGSATLTGSLAQAKAVELLMPKPVRGRPDTADTEQGGRAKAQKADDGLSDAERDAKKTANKQAQHDSLLKKYGDTKGEMKGTTGAAVFHFGDKLFDATAAGAAWSGCCIPGIIAASMANGDAKLARRFIANNCPDPDSAGHEWNGACHTVPDGAKKASSFIINPNTRGDKGGDRATGKGKGKGGRSKGKGGRGAKGGGKSGGRG